MNQKTVQLDWSHYRLNNNVVEVLKPIDTGSYETYPELEWTQSRYKIGVEVMLYSTENTSPNSLRDGENHETFGLMFDAPGGIGGNMNNDITRYHGWRGTTSDISTSAHGLRKITKIRELKNGRIAVTVGPDLYPNEA